VRNDSEQKNGIIADALLIELKDIFENINNLNSHKHYFIHCAGGYRSMIAASILKKYNIENVTNIIGGMAEIKKQDIQLVSPQLV
jgi:hydroxyacylglutathione hydrolase